MVYWIVIDVSKYKHCRSGPFKWRDSKLPWEILVKQCADRMLGAPTWDADTKEIKMEDRVEPYRLDFGNWVLS